MRGGELSGWGATCTMHHNDHERGQGLQRTCKKQVGINAQTSADTARLRVMAWLLAGTQIPSDSAHGRSEHLKTNAHALALEDEAEMERKARLIWGD